MANQGTFIVIEGSDGSGKGTQFRLLKERLRAVGYEVAEFDFPRYDQPSSHFVQTYLNGGYGPAKDISPYTASLFYALDRYEAAKDIRSALKDGKIVLANRYVGSNMAHQGSKIDDPIEQRSFFVWEDSLEFQLLGLPRPNVNIYLRVPAETSFELIKKKSARSYTNKSHDEHEANIQHLQKAVSTYDTLCRLFPRDFAAIDCVKDGQMLSIPEINNLIWEAVAAYLPPKPTGRARSVTLRLDEDDRKVSKKPAASSQQTSAPKRLKFVSLSVGQLMEIERLTPDSAQFRLSWEKNGYGYLSLNSLPKNVKKKYEQSMETLADLNKTMREKLGSTSDKDSLLAPLLPLSALIKVELETGTDKRVEQVLNQKVISGAPSQNGIQKLARSFASSSIDAHIDPVTLLEFSPRNEFKLLADGLYSFSNMSRDQLSGEIEKWDYQKKVDALSELLKSGDSDALNLVRYRFDLLADQQTINKLIKQGVAAESIHVQPPSPRYGYDVPETVEKLGIEDEYIRCFDTSLELYSSLQAAGEEELAQVAVLLGHKVRFQLECPLSELHSIAKIRDDSLKSLVEQMLEKVGEIHPLIKDFVSIGSTEPSPKRKSRRSRAKRS